MPLEEVRERFTISEMALISWRSQEQYWQMKVRLGNRDKKKKVTAKDSKVIAELKKKSGGKRIQYGDRYVDSMPDEWFNEDGELDMRLMPGREAVKYMNARSKEIGLPLFPMVGGMGRGYAGPDVIK